MFLLILLYSFFKSKHKYFFVNFQQLKMSCGTKFAIEFHVTVQRKCFASQYAVYSSVKYFSTLWRYWVTQPLLFYYILYQHILIVQNVFITLSFFFVLMFFLAYILLLWKYFFFFYSFNLSFPYTYLFLVPIRTLQAKQH